MRRFVAAGIVAGALGVLGACEPKSGPSAPTTLPAITTTVAPPSTTVTPPTTIVGSYVVVGGDTLSAIAHKFDVSVADLAAFNEITNIDAIQVGQELKIPPHRPAVSTTP